MQLHNHSNRSSGIAVRRKPNPQNELLILYSTDFKSGLVIQPGLKMNFRLLIQKHDKLGINHWLGFKITPSGRYNTIPGNLYAWVNYTCYECGYEKNFNGV
jgi:hypothetical protein